MEIHSICASKTLAMKQIIKTDKAPAPIGPYNQAVKTSDHLYISGQIPIDPATNELIEGSIKDEAHRVMQNLQAILEEAKLTFEHVVKTTIFLSDMNLFAAVNEIYGSYFKGDYPARETVAVKGLPKGVNVEISMIAVVNL
jgi:2-iminobutanoate/2-iminopropanoate deaminase